MRSRAFIAFTALTGALVSGGWLLQRGFERTDSVYARARLFDDVLDRVARDYVDSHRMFSNYLLWLFPLMIATWVIPQAAIIQLVIIAMFFGLLVEWYVVGARLRRMAISRFGSAQGGAMSIGFYAGSRAWLPRRWRLPAPQVERGDEF